MRRVLPLALLSLALALAGVGTPPGAVRADAPAPLLADPDFAEWTKDGVPARWSVAEGAHMGDGPVSTVTRGAEGGVRLSGDAVTRRWSILEQAVSLREGATYRLAFEARALGVRREPGQNDNVYVGVRFAGPAPGAPGRFHTDSPLRDVWTPGEIVFRATAPRAEVLVFLSKTGALEARRLVLEELAPEASFDVLARQLTRYYSYFAAKKIDPVSLLAKHRESFPKDGEPVAFAKAAQTMLAELRDLHVSIRVPAGQILHTSTPSMPLTYDYRAVAARLKDPKRVGRIGLVGTIDDDLGYVAVTALDGLDASHAALVTALDGLLGKAGLLLDLRANGGGDEKRALVLASRLADEARPYARRRVRSGPAPGDLSEPMPAWVRPLEGASFRKPIVVLVGPGCVSSGEGFAKMMAVLPHAVLMGQPTHGASGSPAPVDLPNGVSVRFSRWVDELPDGTPTEGVGVIPDVLVSHAGPGDPTFEAGVARLRELVKK